MKITRRLVLRGLGGAALALPLLESWPRSVGRAQGMPAQPFAIFLRQANGVACAQESPLGGREPERFWPTQTGPLTEATMMGRAVDELLAHRERLLIVGNVNMKDYEFGDGHARGALQGLTARGPVEPGKGGDSEAAGMSLDHRIGAELNPGGRDSLFMYAGAHDGWLGGSCISYRSAGMRRAAFRNPKGAFEMLAGAGTTGMSKTAVAQVALRQKSINDLLRAQMKSLLGQPRLGAADRKRLQQHFDSIRDVETRLSCELDMAAQQMLDGAAAFYNSNDGSNVWKTARLHIDIAVTALSCGSTRSVALQIGNGNDGSNRYRDPDTNQMMENFHFISHRRSSHDDNGDVIPNSDVLHHKVDRQFAQTYKYLLDKLAAHTTADGKTLLDQGVAVWYNDLGNGPSHSPDSAPFILAGSASGYFKQGQYIKASGGAQPNHNKMLNTIGAAVGLKNAAGAPLDDFGDPALPKGQLSELRA